MFRLRRWVFDMVTAALYLTGWDLNFTYQNTNTADYFVTGNENFNSWSHAHHLAWNIRACEQIQYEDSWKFGIWVLGCISRNFWHRLNWQNFCTGSLTLQPVDRLVTTPSPRKGDVWRIPFEKKGIFSPEIWGSVKIKKWLVWTWDVWKFERENVLQ